MKAHRGRRIEIDVVGEMQAPQEGQAMQQDALAHIAVFGFTLWESKKAIDRLRGA